MKNIIRMIILTAAALAALCCTAITDFDESRQGKLDIGEMLSDPLVVTLDGNMATVRLEFGETLPVDDQDAIFHLIGTTVELLIRKDSNNVGVSLTTTPVTEPQSPGEYSVSFADDDQTMEITFYNETTLGQTLQTSEDYTCLITVGSVNDHFEVGNWVFEVDVQN